MGIFCSCEMICFVGNGYSDMKFHFLVNDSVFTLTEQNRVYQQPKANTEFVRKSYPTLSLLYLRLVEKWTNCPIRLHHLGEK